MSLTVHHLNGDTTFLLTFSPPFAPAARARTFPGAVTILVDPWLTGDSSLLHPSFQLSRHAVQPAIASLTELEHVDLIIITQDKPDHCHRETLCSLPKDTCIPILATPAAAKRIRKWQYFDHPDVVQVMHPYQPNRSNSIIRLRIQAYSSASAEGEITIANVPAKFDLAGVHNAIGITYCPPGTVFRAAADGSIIDLQDLPMMNPNPPQATEVTTRSTVHSAVATDGANAARPDPPVSTESSTTDCSPDPTIRVDSRLTQSHTSSRTSTSDMAPKPPLQRLVNGEKVLSVVYTPHGIGAADLQPYISTHLAPLRDALPLTALFHCLTVEANPWLLGGRVNSGAPGGVKLLEAVPAKHWVGAHDESKENHGLAVTWLKTQQYSADDVRSMLQDVVASDGVAPRTMPQVHVLACGEVRRLEA